MDDTQVKHVLEAALLAAGRPIPLDKLVQLFATKGPDVDRDVVRHGLEQLAADYDGRGLQVKEVASGFRIQIKSSMSPWLQPLWEERQPRYSRALLETLALIAYRQPITRGEIEDVRGVTVNPNIIKTMLERNWIRVVGHRDVPGKPEMFGTTREFLDYFGLRSIDELPALAEINEHSPMGNPQVDLLEDINPQESQGTEAGEATGDVAALLDAGASEDVSSDVSDAAPSDAAEQGSASDEALDASDSPEALAEDAAEEPVADENAGEDEVAGEDEDEDEALTAFAAIAEESSESDEEEVIEPARASESH
jgi:segregation and condensation protein B